MSERRPASFYWLASRLRAVCLVSLTVRLITILVFCHSRDRTGGLTLPMNGFSA